MDEITRRVRSMYEEFPYPPGSLGLRIDGFPRLLLSYLAGAPAGKRLSVLDAGCGAADSLLAMAAANPDVDVLGADMNKTALRLQRERIDKSGLTNVRVQEVDLMTHAGLDVPAGGFDVVISSGVVHHQSDPAAALRKLREVLAPGGVMVVMVYGHFGRTEIARLSSAIDLFCGAEPDVATQLALGRGLITAAAARGECAAIAPDQEDPRTMADAEFVDRYLHVQERYYTVRELFALLESVGLRLLRWLEPREWSACNLFADDTVVERLEALPPLVSYEIIERLFSRPSLSFVACHAEATAAPALALEELEHAAIAWNPQALVSVTRRALGGERELVENVVVQVRVRAARELNGSEAAVAAAASGAPLPGAELLDRAAALHGSATREELLSALGRLLEEEALYVVRG